MVIWDQLSLPLSLNQGTLSVAAICSGIVLAGNPVGNESKTDLLFSDNAAINGIL